MAEPAGLLVTKLPVRFGELPHGPWSKPPHQALVLPLAQQGQKHPAGVFIAGTNPFRRFDDGCRSFIGLLGGQIAAGLANARAYEQERRRAQALAEIDRAKTTFFNNVSHEFRTPLTLLLGPLEDARRSEDALPPETRQQLQVARRNSLRLLKLVNTLLDFSRIEAGRVHARYEPVDLCALTADLASTFQSAMDRAGLRFDVQCRDGRPRVHVDRDMWEKIVLNLLSNAFKYTLNGGVTVSISEIGDRAVLEVADTGSGIPAHELPHVFDRFHRVEGTHGRSFEGSGIGLALVNELVKLHAGDLSVESTVGAGSRFTVSIPLGTKHLPEDQIAPAAGQRGLTGATAFVEEALRWLPDSEATEPGLQRQPEDALNPDERGANIGRILLADDNADLREYATRLMVDRWRVDAVSNGRDALARARATRPDVIVTDVMMPQLDGFGLLRELRADPELQHTPVIMLSARAGEEARIDGLAASADDYLVKPFSARDLLARVEAQLIRGRAREIERRHARRMSNLLTHAPVPIAVLRGPAHTFELANAPYVDLVGRRQLLGKTAREAFPELEQGFFELLDRVRESGEPFVGQSVRVTLNRGPDGSAEDCYFDFVYQPLFNEGGGVDSIVVVAHDVTALATAKLEAERANQLKDEFLATLSHELRTPLNAILGYTQLLRAGIIGVNQAPSVLQTIERNARLQEQLVNDILDVSRIITGKLRLDIQTVDVARVIFEAIETVMPAVTAKGVTLESAIEPTVAIAGDPHRLQQVVWNLLANAVKFTPRGGQVQIRLAQKNSHVEIAVADNGAGIDPEFLPHVFQRFTQANSSTSRVHGGLGLGLAISRHVVEAHGGHIEVLSDGKDTGTTVRVELPLTTIDDASADARPEDSRPPDLFRAQDVELAALDGLQVLVVDDDRDALQIASETLSAAGARVITASNAAEAASALDGHRIDVAVLDIGMPEVDGYELLRRIRRRPLERQGTVPAIALTAYARGLDRARAMKAGFQMHLTKPVQADALTAAVLTVGRAHGR